MTLLAYSGGTGVEVGHPRDAGCLAAGALHVEHRAPVRLRPDGCPGRAHAVRQGSVRRASKRPWTS
jgi:hypothetical protein